MMYQAMPHNLALHPGSKSPVSRVTVDVSRTASGLLLFSYMIEGRLEEVALPESQQSARTDELWRHTCFEAFVSATAGYYELNFSPSSQWAAYHFDDYRAGMTSVPTFDPAIVWRASGGKAILTAGVALPSDATGPLGLSAVIEAIDGTRSYWALAHLPGKPDFHDPACFTAELPPAG